MNIDGKRIAILVADDFEDVELTEPREQLANAGAETFIVGIEAGTTAEGKHGTTIEVEYAAGDVSIGDFDALMIPGGQAPEKLRLFFERQIAFTAAAPEGAPPDLIVWPETAIPWVLDRAGPAFEAIRRAAGGTPVVLGLQRLDGPRYFNSLVRLDAAGEVSAIYDKHHLVPFGEYMPFGDFLAKFGIYGLASNAGHGYSADPGPRVIDLGGIGAALPLICYEGVFPQDVGGYDRRPDLILLLTNDAWFGQLSGPYQHLAQARLRSAEQGLPMIRVANTGVSAIIDATGRVSARIPLGAQGWTDARMPPALPPTPYARMGDGPLILGALLVLALLIFRHRHRSPGAVWR